MASNIKIIGNILNTSTVTRYSEEDIRLISSKRKQELFGGEKDYIEYFIYDIEGNLLNINYNYLDYKLPSSSSLSPAISIIPNTTGQIQTTDIGIISTTAPTGSSLYPIIEIDPIQDLQDLGYSSGEFNVRYNFFEKKISDNVNQELFVKEISRDRTEIRLGSVILTDEQIESGSLALIDKINNTEDYYVDYILNFGDNQQYVAVNVALNKDPEGYEILFKLYKPLPLEIQEKQTLWVVEEKVIPYTFDINLDKLIVPPPPPTLRGPNFDIEIEGQGTISTTYNNYSVLISNLQSLQNSSYNQIQSLITSQSIDINIDYSNFNNFVFFGSAYRRVVNFYNKIKEIEFYQSEINTLNPTASTTASLQTILNQYSSSINNIIAEFDGLEYYLYFNSGSSLTLPDNYSITPYPKSNSLLPYTLLPSYNPIVTTWYNNTLESALEYDRNNYDNLEYAIPLFIKDDEKNQPFLLFLNMVGHYFDNIWIYLKAVTDINLANNNLEYGISRDLVYQQLKSLGIKLYNSQAGESVDNYLIGANTGSVLWNDDFSVTSSYLNNIPRKDLVAELYKRIYHNLPLLLKTKGTVTGLNNLMTTFGIPNRTYYTVGSESFYTPTGSAATASILNVKEFGGSLKSELISGYNNDKVRISPNNILGGNILSPLKSLQEYPITSSEFRDDDLHYVDISFSPQTQIDTHISKSISLTNPTWNLDDYIGDPSQLYSGSYPDLDAQRKLYFETGVPGGLAPFTSSLLDYNGFIRLIEFFDNSLFKMLNDFVPERTSLSTGVTINSPVLERNKAAYARPTVTTQSVYEANYDIANISSQYGSFYNALSSSNNSKAWYDGDISGSIVDINQYFEDNYNPYLGNWDIYNSQRTTNEYINNNTFLHSDWSALLNNISSSVTSSFRNKIEYFYGTTHSITLPVELQDSYLSLRSYNISRYEGSKLTSFTYNDYYSASFISNPNDIIIYATSRNNTLSSNYYENVELIQKPNEEITIKSIRYDGLYPGLKEILNNQYTYNGSLGRISFTLNPALPIITKLYITYNKKTYWGGDSSYGKSAVIDRKSYKVGWVKNIPSQSLNFSDKTQIQLKYLVDKDFNITDLTLKNDNLFEVQNTFKSGKKLTISLSDPIKPSNQKNLNGSKLIFRGGFSYDPIVFREFSEPLKFKAESPFLISEISLGSKRIDLNFTSLGNVSPSPDEANATISKWRIDEFSRIQPLLYHLYLDKVQPGEMIAGNWQFLPFSGVVSFKDKNPPVTYNIISEITSVLGYGQYDKQPSIDESSAGNIYSTNFQGISSIGGGGTLTDNNIQCVASYNIIQHNQIYNNNQTTWSLKPFVNNLNYPIRNFPGSVSSPGFRGDITDYQWFITSDATATDKKSYFFDFTKFEITSSIYGGYNVESEDITSKGKWLFVAPRTGLFKIKSELPIATYCAYPEFAWPKIGWNSQYSENPVSQYENQGNSPVSRDGNFKLVLTDVYRDGNWNNIPGNYQYYIYQNCGVAFKVFGVVEKSTDNGITWTYVACTRLQPTNMPQSGKLLPLNPSNRNVIFWEDKQGRGSLRTGFRDRNNFGPSINPLRACFNMQLWDFDKNKAEVEIPLVAGEILRYRICIIDCDNFLKYGGILKWDIGRPNNEVENLKSKRPEATQTWVGYTVFDYNQAKIPYPYFQIEDTLNKVGLYEDIITIDDKLFTFRDNILSFTSASTLLFISNSQYVPGTTYGTNNLYSEVLDYMSIQPGDLIRLSSFNNPSPDYYTVLSASLGYPAETFAGEIIFPSIWSTSNNVIEFNTPNLNIFQFYENDFGSVELFFKNLEKTPKKQFTITNTSNSTNNLLKALNNKTFTIKSSPGKSFVRSFIPTVGDEDFATGQVFFRIIVTVAVNETVPTAFSTEYSYYSNGVLNSVTAEFKSYTPPNLPLVMNAVLDKNITAISLPQANQSFAFLRPKPDETSVIINYKKRPGEISQAILIPDDANDDVKNNLGNIYLKLGTNTNNTTINE